MTPKRFLVVLGHSLHVRNFVASGCLDQLAARGHALTVLMPGELLAEVRRVGRTRLADLEPLEPYAAGRSAGWRRRRFRIASFVQRSGFKTYRHKVRVGAAGSWSYALEARAYARLARRRDLEALARRVEMRMAPRRAALDLIDRVRPHLVFAPTLIHDGSEVEVLKAARARGVPVAAFAATWDTLTSKGFFLIPPDRLLVWGEESRRHAAEHHGLTADRVLVTGAPHLDVYGADAPVEPRARFLAARGIDPAQRVILFAGTTISYWEDEPRQLRALSDAIQGGELKDCVVWYRPHPRRAYRDVQAIGELPGVFVDDQVVRQKTEGVSSYSSSPDDLAHYRNLMSAVEAVVAAFSTMILEAALLGKPSLVVAFGAADGAPGRLFPHAEYEHSIELLATPGVLVCHSLDELKQGLQRVFAGDFVELEPVLRERAARMAHNRDGGARVRIVEALERLADGGGDRR
ncbi:MAG: CDP-glycerol glycerophosphotransferase family protein [Candidatus Rokubacteria bacterium]|nr:CDP-glycerol glycerophosphotransferase family protein [Candidatus Rokubacteria bacterium]